MGECSIREHTLSEFYEETVDFLETISKNRKFYRINPKHVLHIGDSVSDILGAGREGIITCWINRANRVWEYDVKPDLIVESLTEIEEMLLASNSRVV